MEISCNGMPAGRRILLILQPTFGEYVHKVDEEIEDFVIFQTKKKEKTKKIILTWNFIDQFMAFCCKKCQRKAHSLDFVVD